MKHVVKHKRTNFFMILLSYSVATGAYYDFKLFQSGMKFLVVSNTFKRSVEKGITNKYQYNNIR